MGVVVAARHLHLDERVALKFLRPEALGNEEAVARFVREARAAVRIKNEHVARVTDVGTLESGAPYIVMEYLDGIDLAAWIAQRGPLPFEQAVDFVLQACIAVAEAHGLGIVHRDLKPANLFCIRGSDGAFMIKVLDFGISKRTDLAGAASALGMTKTGAIMGTPLYMSPEQMRSSKNVDATTDIWALGLILFELLAGKPAFVAETVTELAIKVANEPPPPLRAARPGTPPQLEEVILRCLEKDRTRRYRDVGELAAALRPFAGRSKAAADRIAGILQASAGGASGGAAPYEGGPEVTAVAPGTLGTLGAVGGTANRGPRSPSVVVGVAVAALLVTGVTAAAIVSRVSGARIAGSGASTASAAGTSVQPEVVVPLPSSARRAVESLATTSLEGLAATTAQALPDFPPDAADIAPRASTGGNKLEPAPRPAATIRPRPDPVAPLPASAPASPQPPAPTRPAPNCDPPYYFNANGTRIFKKECL
jgi:serine/threonine-protein kinase